MIKIAVARATLLTNAWDTLYQHLQTGTYAISTNNIFTSYNSTLVKDKGYPLVIISPPLTSYEKVTINGYVTNSQVVMNLQVYDDNSQDVKALLDEVINKLITGKSVFQAVRLMNMNIENMDYDTWADGKKKIHRMSIAVEFRYMEET